MQPVLSTVDWTDFLSRNAITIFDRLEVLKALQSPQLAGELAPGKPVPVVGASGSPALGDCWNADLDRDLLKDTLKHGYGNYVPMRVA